MKKILVVLVGVMMISSFLFAGQSASRSNTPTPTTDAALWGGGGNYSPPANSVSTSRDHGQTTRVLVQPDNRVSPGRGFGQSVKDFLKFIQPLAEHVRGDLHATQAQLGSSF